LWDFYDLYAMADAIQFDKDTLVRAVRATFDRRATRIDAALPAPLTAVFYANGEPLDQWRAYVTRNGLTGARRTCSRSAICWPASFSPYGRALPSELKVVGTGRRAGRGRKVETHTDDRRQL
jgi:hypothetical protein